MYSDEFEQMNNIKTNHLIALCEIKNDYKSFYDDLDELVKSKNNKDLVNKVYNAMQRKSSNKYKNFIEKHKHTIEIMNKYSCLSNLTILSYDELGNRRKNLSEDYFYQYIKEHKEDIETIKKVALKIKTLGFNKIIFDENLDFTKIEYKLFNEDGSDFAFLENIEVIPTYLHNPITYKTNGSSYRMTLRATSSKNNKIIMKNGTIELNSLIFNPDRLPNEITLKSTIEVINELAYKKKEENDDLLHSINLSICINDLENHFKRLKAISERIDKIKNNQELINLLSQMQNILTQLQLFGINFENQTINSNKDITEEIMKKEKKLYIDRRNWSNIED